MKKITSILVVLALLISLAPMAFADTGTGIDRSEKVKLTYLYPLGSGFEVVGSMAENRVVQKASEVANVEIEFIHPPAGQEAEQFNLILASDDLPDIITHGWGIPQLFPGGADKAINDGYYIPLNDLIAKYAPNFSKILGEDDNVRKDITTDNGHIWGMPMVDKTVQPEWCGPAIRQDMFDKLNIATPTTIGEWYDALTLFVKNKDMFPSMVAPLMMDASGHGEFFAFIGAYDVTEGFDQIDGKVSFGPMQPGFKDYLMEMNKWYNEGLIQKDFAVAYNRTNSLTTDKCAAVATSGFWEYDSMKAAAENPEYLLVGAPYPSLVKGEKPHISYMARRSHLGYHTPVTTSCENPERAVDWMDWWYGEEGSLLANWGVEGEDWQFMPDGSKNYLPKIAQNTEGVAIPIIYFKYLYSHGAFLREWDRECPSYGKEANECQVIWLNSADSDHMIPTFTSLLPEESDEFTSIMSDINTYVAEMKVKFIMGEESFDNYDKFLETLNQMKIERAIVIKQGALDRFAKR